MKRGDTWTPKPGAVPNESGTYAADDLQRQRATHGKLKPRLQAGGTGVLCTCKDARLIAVVEPPPRRGQTVWRVFVLPGARPRRLDQARHDDRNLMTECRCGRQWNLSADLLMHVARDGRRKVDAPAVALPPS